MKKFCNHCGKLYNGDRCDCRKKVKREYKHDSFYDSPAWRSCSKFVRVRDYNMDRVQMYFEKYKPTTPTETGLYNFLIEPTGVARKFGGRLIVHHVKEITEAWGERFNIDNLITVDYYTHEYIHELYSRNKEEVQGLLFKIIKTPLP